MHLPFYDIRVILPSVTVLLSVFLIVYCLLNGKKTKLLYSYILLQIIACIWSSGRIVELMSDNQGNLLIGMSITFSGVCFAGFAWLLFCGLYTRNGIFSRKRIVFLLLIPPASYYLLLLTNDYHHLFFIVYSDTLTVYGIACWLHSITIYLYLLTGIAMTLVFAVRRMKTLKTQSVFLIIAVIIPFAVNFIAILSNLIFKERNDQTMDMTPFGMAISLLIFMIVSFRYRFLNIVPIAWQKIINSMNDSIIVVDRFNTIVSFNQSFAGRFPDFVEAKTDNLDVLIRRLAGRSDEAPETVHLLAAIGDGAILSRNGELNLREPEVVCFSVSIQPVMNKRGGVQGKIVLFHDITEDKRMLRELNGKNDAVSSMNRELSAANARLVDYARTVEELAVAKERNRIARDTHDTLGHTLTLLIALLEVSAILCERDPAQTKAKLAEASRVAKQGIRELRRSIGQKTEIRDLLDSLQKLFSDCGASGMNVDFSVEGPELRLDAALAGVIYRTCQEALTNAMRHGRAARVVIFLRFGGRAIKLFIFDDGCGCRTIAKGMGLTGMEQRVKECGGTIEYGSSGERGFNISVDIPLPSHQVVADGVHG